MLSEYILLLQRMEQGMLSAEEQGRFNSLKSRLGKAQGGIMKVNMKRGQRSYMAKIVQSLTRPSREYDEVVAANQVRDLDAVIEKLNTTFQQELNRR